MIIKKVRENKDIYLGQSNLLVASEERSFTICLRKKRLDLLYDGSNEGLGASIALLLRGSTQTGGIVRLNLAEESVHEEANAGAEERILNGARWGQERRGVSVCKELSYDARFSDDIAIV